MSRRVVSWVGVSDARPRRPQKIWFQVLHAFQLLFDDRSAGPGRLRSRLCALSIDDVRAVASHAICRGPSRSPGERSDTRGASKFRSRISLIPDIASLIRATSLNMRPHSRGAMRPKFSVSFALLRERGRGEDRVRAAPAVSQACCKRICCPRAYRFSGEPPASPTQRLYGLYEIVLVTLLFVTPSLSGSFRRPRT